jgi:hypothetical protein
MDSLTIFGLFAVTAMLIFYAFEERNPLYILCFAGCCALGSIYGFLQGAWPFGVIEAIWAAVAARRWWAKAWHRPVRTEHATVTLCSANISVTRTMLTPGRTSTRDATHRAQVLRTELNAAKRWRDFGIELGTAGGGSGTPGPRAMLGGRDCKLPIELCRRVEKMLARSWSR